MYSFRNKCYTNETNILFIDNLSTVMNLITWSTCLIGNTMQDCWGLTRSSSLSTWRKLGSLATHWAHSEDSWSSERPDGTANSVDPDRTAPSFRSSRTFVYTTCPDLSVQNHRIIKVLTKFNSGCVVAVLGMNRGGDMSVLPTTLGLCFCWNADRGIVSIGSLFCNSQSDEISG